MNKKESISLNKFISDNGICSRRQADKYIEKGGVFVNGKLAMKADKINIGDKVRIMETRPLSKNKRWRLVEVIEKVK